MIFKNVVDVWPEALERRLTKNVIFHLIKIDSYNFITAGNPQIAIPLKMQAGHFCLLHVNLHKTHGFETANGYAIYFPVVAHN